MPAGIHADGAGKGNGGAEVRGLESVGEVGRCHGAAPYSDGAKESMAIYANDYRELCRHDNGTNHPIGARRGIARAEGYPSGGRGAPP